MDINEVKAFLESEDGKALLNPMLEAAKQPLLAKRDELLAEKDSYRNKIAGYEALGDLDTLTKAVQAITKTPVTEPVKQEVDKDLLETLRGQIAERDTALTTFKQNIVKTKTDAAIDEAIRSAKGNSKLLKSVVMERIKSGMDSEGNVVIEAYHADGRKIYRADETVGSIEDVINELKKDADYGMAFGGSGASGSGTRSTSKTNAGVPSLENGNTRTEVMAYLAKQGKHN